MSAKKINFALINGIALASFESLLRQWLPDGKRNGAEYSALNPTRADSHAGSFTINIHKGIWQDFASGDSGSDPVSLYAYLFCNNDQGAAAKALSDSLGVSSATGTTVDSRSAPAPAAKEKEALWQVMPPPANAPEPPRAHPFRGRPEMLWCYRSLIGEPLGYMYRLKNSEGGKEILPLTWCKHTKTGVEEWRWLSFTKPRWLYGLDRLGLKPNAPVLIVEGEKCADAAAAHLPHLAVVSWPGGGKAVDKADWSPLAGKQVIIWPDCDSQKNKDREYLPYLEQPGLVAANKVAAILSSLDCKVWMMPVEQPGIKKNGWDVVDAIDEGLAGDELADFIHIKANFVSLSTPFLYPTALPSLDSSPALLSRKNLARLIAEIDDFDELTGDLVDWISEAELSAPSVDYLLALISKKAGVPKSTLYDALKSTVEPELSAEIKNPQQPANALNWKKQQLEDWEIGLISKPRGGLEDCRENVFLILSRHPEWVGVIGWNDFTRRIEKTRPTPFGSPAGEWKTADDYETGLWLAQQCDLLLRSEGTIISGVAMCADKNKFHPVQDWLNGLPPWDRVNRLDSYISDCVGCENTRYVQLVGTFFMIGVVARIFKPGCSMQYMPILEGLQGIGKSSLWRILGGEWFQDTPLKLGDKDAYMQLTGTLIYEIAEMDSFNKAESTLVKGFITQENDRFREPYGRRPVDNPRQCVFVGTTNHGEYLKDTTGNRRFWPIKAKFSDTELMKSMREALFSEALHYFKQGARWHPSRDEERDHFVPEQDARRIVDPWLYPLQDWLEDVDQRLMKEFTVTQLLMGALKVELNKIDGNRGMATRIGNLMSELGWERRRRTSGRREWAYHRPAKVETV